jgi:hypothetical protein
MTDSLAIDVDQIEILIEAVFRQAPRGFVSLRSFRDDKTQAKFLLHPFLLRDDFHALVDVAANIAQNCADAAFPVVFCPPDAVFRDGRSAEEANVMACRSLTVDCDTQPRRTRRELEMLLGPPTIVVFSGGDWVDEATGECEPKQHLRWRLNTWAEGEALKSLKEARRLAAAIAGADTSGANPAHCFRWPGSWHRKNIDRPALCRIETESLQPDIEIDLAEALSTLRSAWEIVRAKGNPRPETRQHQGGTATPHQVAARFGGIVGYLKKAPEGSRNKTLFWGAKRVRDMFADGDIDGRLAGYFIDELSKAAVALGLDQAEIAKTVGSALKEAGR